MRAGLFRKVYLHGLLLLALVTVSVGVIGLLFERPRPRATYAGRLAADLGERGDEVLGGGEELARDLAHDREWLGLEVSIYDLGNKLRLTNVSPPLPPLDPAEIARLPDTPRLFGLHHRGAAVPVAAGGKRIGYAILRSGALAPHLLHGAGVLAIVLVVLALGSIPLARQITSPLEKLTRAVERFGSGDLSARAGIRRRDEVGDLASAFDEMADRLERLVRGEKELLANVSHELRTPLARVRVALEIAGEGDEAKARECLREIAADLAELERLVGDVMTAARLDLASGHAGATVTPLRKESIAVEDLVRQAAGRFQTDHPERNLEVRMEDGLPAVSADPALLRRAIDNLLDNARKYSEHDRPILLAARAEIGSVVLEVRDQGIGIDPADQARLFTPFFRAERSRDREKGGVGLGLVLARRIVEAHGGTIAIESVPDVGTIARITMPASEASAAS